MGLVLPRTARGEQRYLKNLSILNICNAIRPSFREKLQQLYSNSLELGLRINQQIYLDAFYDAGNIWARPQDFNPTRLFRGVGFGGSIVTPLGPLGIDWGYGLDRNSNGVSPNAWEMHFKLGQIF